MQAIAATGYKFPYVRGFGSDLLMLGLGVYDLVWNRRLHPAWLLGVAWAFSLQATAIFLLHNPAWKALSLRLIGH